MDKKKLLNFLIKARTQTYAGGGGKVAPAFKGAYQLESREGEWFYRDFYNLGNAIFMGLETVYFKDKPVWSMCYYGDFAKMTEKQIDEILRAALIKYKDKARLWHKIEWKKANFRYVCQPDFQIGIEKVAGLEEIYKGKEKVYYLFYAGGLIG
jgi:hypothetical protein